MSTTHSQFVAKLKKLTSQIVDLIAEYESETADRPRVTHEVHSLVVEMTQRGICLHRDHKLKVIDGKREKTTRGMCLEHYRQSFDAVTLKQTTKEHLFYNGWWDTATKSGGNTPRVDSPRFLSRLVKTKFSGMTDEEVVARITKITEPMIPTGDAMTGPASPLFKPEALSQPDSSEEPPPHADRGEQAEPKRAKRKK